MVRRTDDDALADAIKAGDDAAAEAFVRKYSHRIAGALREWGIPASDQPDVAQDILVEVFRQLRGGRFEGRSGLWTWIFTIVRGKTQDYRRSAARRQERNTVSLDPIVHADESALVGLADQGMALIADEALARMSARHAVALVLRFRCNVSIEDLAELLGLSPKRIRDILTEAQKMFRRYVAETKNFNAPGRLKE